MAVWGFAIAWIRTCNAKKIGHGRITHLLGSISKCNSIFIAEFNGLPPTSLTEIDLDKCVTEIRMRETFKLRQLHANVEARGNYILCLMLL